MDRAGSHDEHDIFDNSFVGHFVFVLGLLSRGWRRNGFGLRLPGALGCKRSKYLQTHTQVVLFAAKNVIERYLWNGLGRECLKAMKACMSRMPSMKMS